jgi:hypothetical protein
MRGPCTPISRTIKINKFTAGKPVLIAKGLEQNAAREAMDKLSMEFPQSEICMKAMNGLKETNKSIPPPIPLFEGEIKKLWSIYTSGKTWLGFDEEKIKRYYQTEIKKL